MSSCALTLRYHVDILAGPTVISSSSDIGLGIIDTHSTVTPWQKHVVVVDPESYSCLVLASDPHSVNITPKQLLVW